LGDGCQRGKVSRGRQREEKGNLRKIKEKRVFFFLSSLLASLSTNPTEWAGSENNKEWGLGNER